MKFNTLSVKDIFSVYSAKIVCENDEKASG